MGPERAHVQHQGLQDPPDSWNVVFEEQNAARRQVEQGAGAGLRRPDLHRRCGALPEAHKPELGITDPYALDRDAVRGGARAAARPAQAGRPVLARRQRADGRLQERGRGRLAAHGRSRSTCSRPEGARRSDIPGGGRTGWADTTMMHVNATHPNCAYKWLEHSLTPKVQGDVAAWFGSVPSVPAACTGNELLGDRGAARPTASTSSRRSRSGARPSPSAATARRAFGLRALLPAGWPTRSR